jgi:hypothetical protein
MYGPPYLCPRAFPLVGFEGCWLIFSGLQSSDDDDDELIPGGLPRRRRPSATHEAEKRDVLEEDEGEVDFIKEVKALSLASGEWYKATGENPAPPATVEEGIEAKLELVPKETEKHDTK